MRIFIFILLTSVTLNSYGQFAEDHSRIEIIGKYTSNNLSHSNDKHYEEIILNKDSTFSYSTRIGHFIKFHIEGVWTIIDNYLILNEDKTENQEKMVVAEGVNSNIPKGLTKFIVSYKDNTSLNYIINTSHGDTTIILKNQYQSSFIPLSSIDHFNIVSPLLSYPTYEVKMKDSNQFTVKLNSKRIFVNEKWIIEGEGRIRPIGLNAQYASYVLLKEG